MNDRPNPLSFLPTPGECRRVPGGFIMVREWTATEASDEVSGDIVMHFRVSKSDYEAARAHRDQPLLEAQHLLPR